VIPGVVPSQSWIYWQPSFKPKPPHFDEFQGEISSGTGVMNVNVSFLANEYSGFSNLCAFACQQAAQAAALATDRLPKAWQPAIPIYGL
jgi:hypothetical protein